MGLEVNTKAGNKPHMLMGSRTPTHLSLPLLRCRELSGGKLENETWDFYQEESRLHPGIDNREGLWWRIGRDRVNPTDGFTSSVTTAEVKSNELSDKMKKTSRKSLEIPGYWNKDIP